MEEAILGDGHPDGISWDLVDRRNTVWSFIVRGQKAGGRTPPDIVTDEANRRFPTATSLYSIPGAEVGYIPGAGNVFDLVVTSGAGSTVHARSFVMAATSDGLAISIAGVGPYKENTEDNYDHPNPAETVLVDCADVANSVVWPAQR
jgi:hypothetical protein